MTNNGLKDNALYYDLDMNLKIIVEINRIQDVWNDISQGDIDNLIQCPSRSALGDDLERNWNNELIRAKTGNRKPSLKKAIFRTFAKSFSVYGIYLFVQVIILRTLHPIILAEYIQYYDASVKEKGPEVGWLLAGGVILISFFNILIFHHCALGSQRIGMRVRIACCSLVYRKGKTAAGQLVNLLSNDVQRFDQASVFLHYIWLMPIQCVTGFYVMYRSVGIAALAGMLLMALEAIPLQGSFDLQPSICSNYHRPLEIDVIKIASYIRGLYLGLTVFTERLCLYLTLVTFVLLGNRLTGDVVFSMAQLFNTVQLYMAIYYPTALSAYAEAKVSTRRIQEFLLLEENEEKTLASNNNILEKGNAGAIKIFQANATWTPHPIVDTLADINLEIQPGTLCCVVGNVGSGKTSLLQMILKELPLTRGKIEVCGKVSYASQEPWLFVSNVRNNILFGKPFNRDRYHDIVRVCALEKDFQQFPYGDKTFVEERGVSLSGGQRARINLARAVYTEADVYLFDDPLSAVDTHVGKHLFEECIKNYLKNKTRILVTHQLQFLKQADLIVVLNNGKIELKGTFSDLSESKLHDIDQAMHEEREIKKDAEKRKSRLLSVSSLESSILEEEEEEPQETQELIEKGVVPVSIYKEYCRSGASVLILIFAGIFLIVAQMASNASDFWVTHWLVHY
ncbi:hypothetical protein NQ318_022869 [Aromia moschata]|uniref:Uncharacterized protein n=1 Tax=Aromia moschata TaxID=1265417 RepID=A0AAV8XIK6_9CUCU|nr:hypothetical protein NQ318_022869 [Aromia moschata]